MATASFTPEPNVDDGPVIGQMTPIFTLVAALARRLPKSSMAITAEMTLNALL